MNVRWKNKTNRHLNHRWESFNWTHPYLSSFLNVIVNTAKEPEIAKATQRRQNTHRKGVRPPPDPFIAFHAWSDRSNADRFTYNLWHNMEPLWALLETIQETTYVEEESNVSPYEIYSWLPTTRTLANSNLALTRTKVDFPWISFIHLL